MVVSELFAGYKGFGALLNTVKGLKEASETAVRNAITVELTKEILAAQEAQAALVQRVDSLEKELMRFENWESEKQRYELKRLEPGILLYRIKEGMENGEPPHEICANCYNSGVKSLLHNLGSGNGLTLWKCHACGFQEHSGTHKSSSYERRGFY